MEIVFILVEPIVPENIGVSARALKTMGFEKLWLVNPCDHLSEGALTLAHGSHEILNQAVVFNSFKDVRDRCDFLIGTTAKPRKVHADWHRAEDIPELILSKSGTVNCTGIVFGREDQGLSNEELKMCDLVSGIRSAVRFPSLNLGQTVMLYAYLLSGIRNNTKSQPVHAEAGFRNLKNIAEELLHFVDMTEDTPIYSRIFERLALLNDKDSRLLFSVLNAWKERKR